jgi:tetratricopeptide (TPR) repeat protein
MTEQVAVVKESRGRFDLPSGLYIFTFLFLASSIFYTEFLKERLGEFSRLLGADSTAQFALPNFAADGNGYSEDTQDLLKIMSLLKAREPEVSYSQRIVDWQMRADLATELLELPLTEKDYRETLISQIYSLVNLSETRNLRSRGQLIEAIEKHRNHPIEDVRKLALIGDVGIGVIDYLKIENAAADPALKRTRFLLENFPEDEAVCIFLDGQANLLAARRRYEVAIKLLEQMLASLTEQKSNRLKSIAAELPDKILMLEVRFDDAIERLQGNEPGADEFLLDCLAKLASHPQAGKAALEQIRDGAIYYEQLGKFRNARDIYQLLERKMSQNKNPLIAQTAQQTAAAGYARLDSLGKPLPLLGQLPDGKQINGESLRGQIVVVYFWSNQSAQAAFQTSQELDRLLKNYGSDRVCLLGIGTEDYSAEQAESVFKRLPEWNLQLEDHQEVVDRLEKELGIAEPPYVAVLDKQGRLCAINVSTPQLKKQLDSMLGRRLEGSSFFRNSGRPSAEPRNR